VTERFFITAVSGGFIHHDTKSETETVALLNGRDLRLRSQAKRLQSAAKAAGVDHPLLRGLLGIVVYSLLDRAKSDEADDLANHWRNVMGASDRRHFVHELLASSLHPERIVPSNLVSQGVAIVDRAVAERLARVKPASVSASLLIPEHSEKDEHGNDIKR
jgi:hypothetical protein